ncbi:DUF2865 domain-containing protein [Pararhizobium sp. LjRoot235]
MIFRSVRFAVLIAPLLMVMTATADASAVCDRLNARLSNLPKIVASNANVRDYIGAISRQNLDLRKARGDRRRLGCNSGSVVIVGNPNADDCASLGKMIARLESDLETLKARRHLAAGGDVDISRRRIMAALDVNRCAEEQDEILRAAAEEPEIHRNILRDLPPIGENDPALRGGADVSDFTRLNADNGGSLRTLCVRTCDGAFFPISSSATPADFQRDAEACQRRCPGAETALYYHAFATEETDQMVSASTGEPYIELPTAFAYKTRDLAQPGRCGCTPARQTATNQSMPADSSGVLEIRTRKAGTTQARALVEDRPYDPQNSKVRVVGPRFLPSQESSIDLMHPAGPGYQPQQPN